MIKSQEIREQLETFFKEDGYKYVCVNKKNKNLPIPMYYLRFNVVSDETKEIEEEINVMITIFSSGTFIFIEAFNIYEFDENQNMIKVYKLINKLNAYSFPGRFIIDDDNSVSYRCVIDYSNLDKLSNKTLSTLLDSIPPAYLMFLEDIEKEIN